MAKIEQLFKIMCEQKASDLHVSPGVSPYIRTNGDMASLSMRPLTNEEVQALVFEILSEKQKRQFIEAWELDFSHTVPGLGRFRCNVFMERRGLGLVARLIPEKIRTLEELGLPREIAELTRANKGLICVTGPTGSGKSTTLAAIINQFNVSSASHIITIEDPIEFVHENQRSLVNQREVSSHTKSFANALRAALREDPDIILVGELRDLETIQLAITAAETGHLVFATLHTSSAHKTIDRIIDVFPNSQQDQIRVMLSESLRGVVAQNLVPRADGTGRIAAFEVLVNTKAIANLIRDGKTFQIPSTMQMNRNAGCLTLSQSVESLVQRNLIKRETANELLGVNSGSAAGGQSEDIRTETVSNFNADAPKGRPSPATTPQPPQHQPPKPEAKQGIPVPSAFANMANKFKKSS